MKTFETNENMKKAFEYFVRKRNFKMADLFFDKMECDDVSVYLANFSVVVRSDFEIVKYLLHKGACKNLLRCYVRCKDTPYLLYRLYFDEKVIDLINS